MIKFWSFESEYKKYRKNILKIIDKSLSSGLIFYGNNLINFERNFIRKYKTKFGISVGSGTDALMISLMAIGVKKGDEVITAANTAIPTIAAIINSGATPVLADINLKDYLIDINSVKKLITKKTKAIIPVHLYGQIADMDKLIKITRNHKIKIIEDCAQAQGAKYKGKFAGTLGDIGCFSFYPTKILGTYGDGGFILTNNKEIYEKAKRIRFYGIEMENKSNKFFNKYYANENGVNSRLDEIQSGILNFKLKKINEYINLRRKKARLYLKLLNKTELILPKENNDNFHVYHLFTVFHEKRDAIIKKLNNSRIYTRVIYPYPIKNMKPYQSLKSKKLINTNKISKGIFSLPLYPELPDKYIVKVSNILKEILKKIND
ncbi:DegT/DnrJ/EryC1/StrS family aminotransferase [Candidatus Pelagibacter sp.]|nr:DegT/DnrJ/EryC1/StrS family aminotransferase [Candidatus Pelagibacter sp.]